jgi:hypothetical protein
MFAAPVLSKSSIYRRKSSTCRAFADCAATSVDRDQLLAMSRLWLTRADSEDWRDGLPPMPPVQSKALSRWKSVV